MNWDDAISRGGLQVKGKRASVHQAQMQAICVNECRKRGGDGESQAGTVATAIQESTCTNMSGGDRDSQGLFQQRPSMSWGSVAQIRDPTYAVNKFLDKFLAYRRQGQGWLTASHNTQRSAFASAPAKWYGEGQRAARFFSGAGASMSGSLGVGMNVGLSGSTSVGGGTETRIEPYEFSRGTPDKEENSVECAKRLADEVAWRFFARRGRIWFVSENWLNAQKPVIAKLNDLAQGVVEFNFEWETRAKTPPEATMKLVASRYQVAPGDPIDVDDSGIANGRWIVTQTRQNVGDPVVEATIKRFTKMKLEPAPQTTQVSNLSIGANVQANASGSVAMTGAGGKAEAVYRAADQLHQANLPYIWGGGHGSDFHQGVARGYDCSGSCAWVLLKGGIPLPEGRTWGKGAPVSGAFVNWGESGRGQRLTVYANSGHIWIEWHGFPAKRFDTSPYGSGGNGPKQRFTQRPSSGFSARRWPNV